MTNHICRCIKAKKTTRNKRSGDYILPTNFHKKVPSKFQIQYKKQGHVFHIRFWLVLYSFLYCLLRTGGGGRRFA